MQDQLDSILKSLNEVKSTQNKMITSINEQNKTLKSFNKRFDDLSTEINKLATENSFLKTKISELENKLIQIEKTTLTTQLDELNILNELADRQSRAQNIILYNLPENLNNTQIPISDGDNLKLIFKEMKVDYNPINFNRLGKPSDRTRPLKITLADKKSIFETLRAQSTLRHSPDFKDIRFSSDRTIKQREQMALLRKELESRREKGETNIIIKYIKGNPQIINSKNM
ncbi:unnamed protein product [Macrosiphum euphorbiae]|uniref:Uncharacterized protein n=1 Tax=Macrosiphum euphorbiae TaxID=13131 RepID=A0AAV0WB88_9HEMI|nr:unnamed protein product [Macrosiphum euphorbiae]CAI6366730.1 unnamed protein product [Macrosiphum euphorbiae]